MILHTHTPGPWEWGPNPRAEAGAANELTVRPAGEFPHGLWVADVGRLFSPEAEANARLIAAAPDLLEALRPFAEASAKLHSGYDDGIAAGDHPMASVFVSDLRRAAAAISRATGGAG